MNKHIKPLKPLKPLKTVMPAFLGWMLLTLLLLSNLIVSNSLAATNASETVLHANATSKKFHNQNGL